MDIDDGLTLVADDFRGPTYSEWRDEIVSILDRHTLALMGMPHHMAAKVPVEMQPDIRAVLEHFTEKTLQQLREDLRVVAGGS